MGIKAYVDNLGALFGEGFPDKDYTLSRVVTVSRMMNHFFATGVPFLLKNDFKSIYTVFSGGDDLFLIGAWNQILKFADRLNEKFHQFVCKNPGITISCGIAIAKSGTPVDHLAEMAEEALRKSKSGGRNRVTVFNQTLTWDEYRELLRIKDELGDWYRDDVLSRSFLNRLNRFVEMAKRESELLDKLSIPLEAMDLALWRSQLGYQLARNASRKGDDGASKHQSGDELKALNARLVDYVGSYRGKFVIPLWALLYETRGR